MNRLRQLKKNTGWGGVLRTVLLTVFSVGVAFYLPDPGYLKFVIIGALLFPALFSSSFANSPGGWAKAINTSAWGLFAIAILGPQIREHIDTIPGIVIFLWGTIALYVGFFFWFWSHPDIIRLDED